MDIKEISPLYDYWMSNQTDEDEARRLLLVNIDSNAAYLFEKEPYKWENLFQSIIRELIKGDHGSIKAMDILLSTISSSEKKKVLQYFEKELLLEEVILSQLYGKTEIKTSKRKNPLRFLRILFVIFTNPYGLDIRRDKTHLYERTGAFIYKIRKKLI